MLGGTSTDSFPTPPAASAVRRVVGTAGLRTPRTRVVFAVTHLRAETRSSRAWCSLDPPGLSGWIALWLGRPAGNRRRRGGAGGADQVQPGSPADGFARHGCRAAAEISGAQTGGGRAQRRDSPAVVSYAFPRANFLARRRGSCAGARLEAHPQFLSALALAAPCPPELGFDVQRFPCEHPAY